MEENSIVWNNSVPYAFSIFEYWVNLMDYWSLKIKCGKIFFAFTANVPIKLLISRGSFFLLHPMNSELTHGKLQIYIKILYHKILLYTLLYEFGYIFCSYMRE